jgi:GR25 family glycosyltransferase involved in LPS biosynthesis
MTNINVNDCIIINLDERTDLFEKLEQFRELWTKLDKSYTRISGVNYKNSKNVINELIVSDRLALIGIGFREKKESILGEFGCYMAHYNAWKYVVDNKLESCLILEDGIEFLRTDFVNLRIDKSRDIMLVNDEMKYDSSNNQIDGYGLQGYVVTNSGAIKLLEKCHTLYNPIDLQIRNMSNANVFNTTVLSEPFVKRNSNRLSSIGNDDTTNDLNAKQNFNTNNL